MTLPGALAARPAAVLGVVATVAVADPAAEATVLFTGLLDPVFAREAGWDPERGVLSVPAGHPLLGWRPCRVTGCTTIAYPATGLCRGCTLRRRASGVSEEEFVAAGKDWRSVGVSSCAVTGCPRPWASARNPLCLAHGYQRRQRLPLPLPEFLAHPQVEPLPSLGPCRVASCTREQATGKQPYCQAHAVALTRTRRADPELDEARWRLVAPAVAERGEVSLRGLPPLVVAQVLYGLQQRCRAGASTTVSAVRGLGDRLRAEQVGSIEQATTITSAWLEPVWRKLVGYVTAAGLDPDTERAKDEWNMAAFGLTGRLRFTAISQTWLREAAKRWAIHDLPTRRGDQIVGVVQSHVDSVVAVSQSLHTGRRHDHGEDPAALGRGDIEAFLNRLACLQRAGTISPSRRIVHVRNVRKILTRLRGLGMTRPGAVMAGLPEDFAIRPEDLPSPPSPPEPGRDLPPEVMQVLCEHLGHIEDRSAREFRVAIELLIDTGRRPDEICELAWDCLHHDSDGQPVLTYDNWKRQRQGRRLPIAASTAALIAAQKTAVRARFPHTALTALKLLPANVSNPEGTRAISDNGLGGRHRRWVDTLRPLLLADGTEFDSSRAVLYAYRHTYAQRHADAGVPVDVLRELLDHKAMDVTQRYYRIGEQRRRAAVDTLTALQFDRHGNRVWQHAKALLDSEHTRRAIGEVAVPFGVCAEPSNVSAGGHACPYRFRCVGCDHFRTDVSYLPDLHAHLDDLLRTRERLRAATDSEDTVRTAATPSDTEITRTRQLISRVTGELDHLTNEQRAVTEQAITVVRGHRTTQLGMPRVGPPTPEPRPEHTA